MIKLSYKQLFIIIFSSTLVACASPNSGDGRVASSRSDCISQPSIRGYSVLDESNLLVTTSGRRRYHVVLQRRAYGLQSSWGIGLKGPTTGRICATFGEVVFNGHHDDESVRIAAIRELDSEGEEDLLIQFGKKKPEIEHTPAPQEVKGAEVEELDPAADDESSGN